MMEHIAKFLQVGPGKVVSSQVRFIQPSDDWFSRTRLKAVEAKLSQLLESKLPEITSMKPGAVESVSGDLIVGDVKVTYNLRKRSNLPSFIIQARRDEDWPDRDKHEKSVGKFKDYGGMFMRKTVLRSELVVSIRRLTASEMAQHTKVQNSQTARSSPRGISGYFQPVEVQRPKTPEEKAALKRLLDRREAKKRHLSSSDSESNSASENVFDAPKSKQHHERKRLVPSNRDEKPKDSRVEVEPKRFTSLSQPAPEKHVHQAATSREDRIAATQVSKPPSTTSRDKSSSVQSDSSHHDRAAVRHKDDGNKSKASSSQRDKEKSKTHDSTSGSTRSSSSREREHKPRSDPKDARSRDVAASQSRKTEKESSKPSRSDGKEKEPSSKEKSSSRQREKRHHSPPKESRKEEKSSKGSSRERTSKVSTGKSKETKVKTANIKQLLTDCGIDDSDDDSNGEDVSRKKMKKGQDEGSRRSPDSTQLVDVVKPVAHSSKSSSSAAASKRESLEDFAVGKETLRTSSAAAKKQKPAASTLCRSLFLEDEESDEDVDEKKDGQPYKSPVTEDDAVATDVEKEAAQRSPLVADLYEPTPVVKLATDAEQRLPSKPVATNAGLDDEIIRLTRTPPRREPYAPSFRRTPTAPEAFSYHPSSPKQQDDRRKRKDVGFEYIPSTIGSSSSSSASSSAAKPSRGRYEEYVPEAVNRSARHHQSTVDYVPTYIPTPKKEISTDVCTTTTTSPSLASEAPESRPRSGLSLSRQAASKLEQEIRDTRNIKDLDKRHIEYLFIKNLPDLDGIIRRKVKSWRSTKYRKGGKEKRLLTFQVYTSPFVDSQMDFITKLFTEEFLLSRTVDGDYLNQVLIPEFLIRVFMANKGTTHEESDRLMAQMLSSSISVD
ncbi:uncharacterized protein LOC144149604 [Haemaphysalis longicornis]